MDAESRAESIRWWQSKHPGACPMCGSHNGMWELYPDAILMWFSPHADFIGGREWYRQPGREDVVFTPCLYCKTDTAGFEEMQQDEVREWVKGYL